MEWWPRWESHLDVRKTGSGVSSSPEEAFAVRRPRAPKKTAFVPRALLRGAIAGVSVVPMCVATGIGACGLAGCVASVGFDGGDAEEVSTDGELDAMTLDVMFPFDTSGGMEDSAVDVRSMSVAAIGFGDAGDASDGD